MTNTMTCRGYTARIGYDDDDEIFYRSHRGQSRWSRLSRGKREGPPALPRTGHHDITTGRVRNLELPDVGDSRRYTARRAGHDTPLRSMP